MKKKRMLLLTGMLLMSLIACESSAGGVAQASATLATLAETPSTLPILRVPEDFPTIQLAIDAAVDGDEIVVSPGTYTENIDFIGKNIILRSTDPQDREVVATTIIDGGGQGSVVTFKNGETSEARLDGFTIANGGGTVFEDSEATSGGGIQIINSSPTIERNTIESNEADIGAGIYIDDFSSPKIASNEIAGNIASNNGGGILVVNDSSPRIEGNTIDRNEAKVGGGIAVWGNSSPMVENNCIAFNVASLGGGIIVGTGSSPIVVGNAFSNNVAEIGGGIYLDIWSRLILNDPDNNVYDANQPDDIYYEAE